jgi:hypothetical protein
MGVTISARKSLIRAKKPLTAKLAKKGSEVRKENHEPFFTYFAAVLCDLCG